MPPIAQSPQTITLTRGPAGWSWRLLDAAGALAAGGDAKDQEAAMASAWREARALIPADSRSFPDIRVEPPARAA